MSHFEPFSCTTCKTLRQVDPRAVILLLDPTESIVRWACYCHVCGLLEGGAFKANSPTVKRLLDHGATLTVKGDDPGAGRLAETTPVVPSDDDGAEHEDGLTAQDLFELERILAEPGLLENMVCAMAECGLGQPPAQTALSFSGEWKVGMRVIDMDGDMGTVFEDWSGVLCVRYDESYFDVLPVQLYHPLTGTPMFRPVSNG